MFKTVIIISHVPLSSKLFADFFIDKMQENKIEVKYWDVSKILYSKFEFTQEVYFDFVTKINNIKEFKTHLKSTPTESTLYLSAVTYYANSLSIYKALNKDTIKLAFFARGMVPSSITPKSTFIKNSFKKILSKDILKKITLLLFAKYLKKYGYTKSIDVLFQAGNYGYKTTGVENSVDKKSAQTVPINYFDYDKYLRLIKNGTNEFKDKEQYCVYLDEYYPYHPDVAMLGMEPIDPVPYYKSLNSFFKYIEDNLGLKIIISAHPKSNYKENPFMGREIINYKAVELVQYANLVLTHSSSSISYPVLFNKKILLITSDNIKNTNNASIHNTILAFSAELDLEILNMDQEEDFNVVNRININSEKYLEYKYNYLTSHKSEDKPTEDIFLDFLKNGVINHV